MVRIASPITLAGLLILGIEATPAFAQPPQQSVTLPGNDAFQRGWKLDQGIGTPINIPDAIKAYREAATAGNPLAKARLARIYYSGNGVVADKATAEFWANGITPDILKAAEANDPIAQELAGLLYADGLGVPRNTWEELKWLRKAADQNLPLAQANLGVVYENGEGVPRDIVEAANLYRKAADQNNAMAQAYLGDFYRKGQGVPRNPYEAVRLYGLAAAQNFAHAETNLGFMYDHGQVVACNPYEAARLYRLAADQEFDVAQANLGTATRTAAACRRT